MDNTILEIEPRGVVINPKIIRGTTWEQGLQMLSADGVAVDLTGSTAKLTIRNAAGESLLVLTDGDGITLGGATGNVDILLTAEQTAALPLQKLSYNLDITEPDTITTQPVARGTMQMINNTNLPDE